MAGGSRAQGFPTSLYWEPTVLDEVPADSIAVTQETFGPIAPIMSIGSLEEAIEQTNVQSFGLMAAIFTADLAAAIKGVFGERAYTLLDVMPSDELLVH